MAKYVIIFPEHTTRRVIFTNMRTFENIELADAGHTSKVIALTDDEHK
jgi:hypothetical protein